MAWVLIRKFRQCFFGWKKSLGVAMVMVVFLWGFVEIWGAKKTITSRSDYIRCDRFFKGSCRLSLGPEWTMEKCSVWVNVSDSNLHSIPLFTAQTWPSLLNQKTFDSKIFWVTRVHQWASLCCCAKGASFLYRYVKSCLFVLRKSRYGSALPVGYHQERDDNHRHSRTFFFRSFLFCCFVLFIAFLLSFFFVACFSLVRSFVLSFIHSFIIVCFSFFLSFFLCFIRSFIHSFFHSFFPI